LENLNEGACGVGAPRTGSSKKDRHLGYPNGDNGRQLFSNTEAKKITRERAALPSSERARWKP